MSLIETIRPGDRVTIVDRFGKARTGKAVMRSSEPGAWVLNLGGRYGTLGIATVRNVVKVVPAKVPGPYLSWRDA